MIGPLVRSLFCLMQDKCSPQERRLYLWVVGLNYGMQINSFIGFPLWFQQPVLLCGQEATRCSMMTACQADHFSVDPTQSALSLSLQYRLQCDREHLYQWCVCLAMMCGLAGGGVMMVVRMGRMVRFRFYGLSTLSCGLSLLLAVLVPSLLSSFSPDHQLHCIIVLLAINSFFVGITGASYNVVLAQLFHRDFAQLGNVYGSVMQGCVGMVMPLLSYLSRGDWQTYMVLVGVPQVLGGLYGLIVPVPTNPHSLAQPSLIQHSRRPPPVSRPFPRQVSNFAVHVYLFSICLMMHFCLDVELEKVGGNLFLNFTLAGATVMLSGLGVFYVKSIIENYHLVNCAALLVNCLLFSFFFVAPLDLVACPFRQQFLYICLMILMLFSVEFNVIFLQVELNYNVRVQHVQLYYSLILLFSRSCMAITPFLTYHYTRSTLFFSVSVMSGPCLLGFLLHSFLVREDPQCRIDMHHEITTTTDILHRSLLSMTRSKWSFIEQTIPPRSPTKLPHPIELSSTLIQ